MQTHTLTYAYDALARLTESITPERTYTYGYDLSGGRLSEGYGGVTRTFSYNAANQLISDGVHTYTYDRSAPLSLLEYIEVWYNR